MTPFLPADIRSQFPGAHDKVYRLVDMGGTTVNVMGNMVGTILVSHSEKGAT